MHGEVAGGLEEFLLPQFRFWSSPGRYGARVEAQRRVGNHEVLGNVEGGSESFADRAGSDGIVEVEHLLGEFGENYSVGFEEVGEFVSVDIAVLVPDHQNAASVAFEEGCLRRFRQARQLIAGGSGGEAVDQQFWCVPGLFLQIILDVDELTFGVHKPGVSFFGEYFELLRKVALLREDNRSHDSHACSFGICRGRSQNIFHGVVAHFAAAYRRECVAHTAEEHAQVVVDFGGCAHCAPGIACVHFLLHGNGRRQPADEVAFGLAHLAHELAGIGREAFDIAPAAFGIQCVEGKR